MGRTSLLRVMLADDSPQWRRYLISRLQDEPDLEIVCVAADEFEAIQKANELQPDLILIGVGLPNKHGIEAIRQIRTLAPPNQDTYVESRFRSRGSARRSQRGCTWLCFQGRFPARADVRSASRYARQAIC